MPHNEEAILDPVEQERQGDCVEGERSHNKQLGAKGEQAAACYLSRQGYEILERNWCCGEGEADIIARDEEDLVFVEVKTRSSEAKGFPAEAVTAAKRRKYEGIAMSYLKQSDICSMRVRFDVISILLLGPDRAFLRHHKNAFGAGE